MAFFSIITINLNNAEGLKRTIESVVSQTCSDYEFIVIDGASTDRSVDVIKSFASKITFWVSEKDTGIYNAMNKGIARANGKYIQFLNSGDCLHDNDVLHKVYQANPTATLVYGNMRIIDSTEITNGRMPEQISILHLYKDTLWHPVTFIEASAFKIYGNYNEHYKLAGDYEFFLRLLLKHHCTSKHLDITVADFYNTGLSAQPGNRQLIASERLKAQKNYFNILLLALFRLYSFLRK